jgi:hypothetical protein
MGGNPGLFRFNWLAKTNCGEAIKSGLGGTPPSDNKSGGLSFATIMFNRVCSKRFFGLIGFD